MVKLTHIVLSFLNHGADKDTQLPQLGHDADWPPITRASHKWEWNSTTSPSIVNQIRSK